MKKHTRLSKKNALYTPRSSATNMINYSKSSRTLEVEYKDGDVYHYFEVEPEKWEEYRDCVLKGGSSGIFVNTEIKKHYEEMQII